MGAKSIHSTNLNFSSVKASFNDWLISERKTYKWSKVILVEVLDAVDLVGGVHGERNAVQAAVTHHADEAVRVVGLPCGPQDALHDGLTADAAGLQRFLRTQTCILNKTCFRFTAFPNAFPLDWEIFLSHASDFQLVFAPVCSCAANKSTLRFLGSAVLECLWS